MFNKKIVILMGFLVFLLSFILFNILFNQTDVPVKIDKSFKQNNQPLNKLSRIPLMVSACFNDGGIWLEQYKECEGVSLEWCNEIKTSFAEINSTDFNECASPCRHNLEAEFCTNQCLSICAINI